MFVFAISWGDSIRQSVTTALSRLLGFIPNLIGALIIIIIGWIIAGIVAKIVTTVLRKLPLQRAADSIGIAGFMQRSGVKGDLAGIIGAVIKWYIRLIALEAAFDALGIPQVAQLFNTVILFLPNLIVALIIVFVGLLLGRFASNLVRGLASGSGAGSPGVFANITYYAIVGFAIFMALNQIHVAQSLLNILFTGLIGALTIAVGLAFGLGGRETAARLLEDWYGGMRGGAPSVPRPTTPPPAPLGDD